MLTLDGVSACRLEKPVQIGLFCAAKLRNVGTAAAAHNGGSVCVHRDERRSRDIVRDLCGSGRRIVAWVVAVTARDAKAAGLGNGSMTSEVN